MILQRIHWRLEEMLPVDVSVEEEHLFDTAEDIVSESSLILEPCPPILLLSRESTSTADIIRWWATSRKLLGSISTKSC
ncbi:hypothetical protein EUGRSUZ_C01925 [Eucalyptus grandis]|uniref:Uncharacterized protein n=2 Tax=Eucalyptus grandis TaxID=71139 RepID=A0ACC3LEM7_EUCGR|nr:hypothetical protein EUGRSUZ_C01925 [Eucalyptus grandis]